MGEARLLLLLAGEHSVWRIRSFVGFCQIVVGGSSRSIASGFGLLDDNGFVSAYM